MPLMTTSAQGGQKVPPVVAPFIPKRPQVAGNRQQLNPRREPQRERAKQRHLQVSPQRMLRRSLSGDFAEFAVLIPIPGQSVVVFFKDLGEAGLLLGRIERGSAEDRLPKFLPRRASR